MPRKPIRERRVCPPEFQERLTRMFGLNEFGDPLYRIMWAQNSFHLLGGPYFAENGWERIGYREKYLATPYPCWQIERWMAPVKYGSPRMWYGTNYVPEWEISIMGPYPWRGRYEVLYQLFRKQFAGRELKIIILPLSHTLIDKVIPCLIEAQKLSDAERVIAQKAAKEYEDRQLVNEIADRMANDSPWYGPVSFAKQGIRTNLLDRMMEKVQKRWSNILAGYTAPPPYQRGMFQGNRPILAK
jgi:hypothetical protein